MAPAPTIAMEFAYVLTEDLCLEGDDILAEFDTGQEADGGAGGDDGVVEVDSPGAAGGEGDLDGVCVGEGAVAVDLGDRVLLHQEVHAFDPAVCDGAAAIVRGPVIKGDVAGDSK